MKFFVIVFPFVNKHLYVARTRSMISKATLRIRRQCFSHLFSGGWIGVFCLFISSQAISQNCESRFTYQVNGLNVSFRDTSIGSHLSYLWLFGDNSSSVDRHPAHQYSAPGDYQVSLSITDSNGCHDTRMRRICVGAGCVWPGDANNDGVVNNKDVLYVGLAFGAVGPIRPDTATSWNSVSASAWISPVGPANFTGINIKHADCDGNGVVNRFDLRVIHRNYNETTHKTTPSGCIDINDLPLYFELLDSIPVGAYMNVAVKLGTNQLPALGVYGIAYTIHYETRLVQSDTVFMDYDFSLFGTPQDIIGFNENFYSDGKIETAIARTDHSNVDVAGTIGILNFVMEDNLAQKTFLTDTLNLSFSDIFLVDQNGDTIPVCAHDGSAVVYQKIDDPSGIEDGEVSGNIEWFPNPAKARLYLKNNFYEKASISVLNILGKKVITTEIEGRQMYEINVADLPAGIYFLLFQSERESGIYKIEIEN